jgi:hypothetical protein
VPGFLDDEQTTDIAGRRACEQGLRETRSEPGGGNRTGLALRSVRVVPVDEVRTRCADESITAVVADDEIDVRHRGSVSPINLAG